MNFKTRLNKYLRKFNVELHGLGYLQSLAKDSFKSDELDVFKATFGNKKILIYDVGAHRGLTVKKYVESFPNALIHAFEPYEPLAAIIIEDQKGNSNVVVNKMGISDKDAELSFNINKDSGTNSVLKSKMTGLNSDKQVETLQKITVPVTTLDGYAKKNHHDRVNILKMDIQGSELNALKGAAGLLKEKKIDIIFAETNFVEQYEGQALFHEILSFLGQYGYVIQDMYHPIYGKGKLAWCDTLFVRDDLKLT